MIRPILAATAFAAGTLLASGAAGQSATDTWTVDYDETDGVCWMEQEFHLPDGVTSSLGIDLQGDEPPVLVMRNSEWTMPEGHTSAEIWFTGDWRRTPDATAAARYHAVAEEGGTHIDVAFEYEWLDRLGATDTLTVRVQDGPFERYYMGPTDAAVAVLAECYRSSF
jgi:hypothetical protein